MSETTHPGHTEDAPSPPEVARTEASGGGGEVAERMAEDRPTETARERETHEAEARPEEAEGVEGESRLAAARRKHAERMATLRLREANEPDPRALKGLLRAPAGTPGISLAGVDLSTPEGCGLAEDRVLELALTTPLLPPIWAREMSILLRDRAERKREMARRARGEPPGPADGRSRRK